MLVDISLLEEIYVGKIFKHFYVLSRLMSLLGRNNMSVFGDNDSL